jgi:hypothetical protein
MSEKHTGEPPVGDDDPGNAAKPRFSQLLPAVLQSVVQSPDSYAPGSIRVSTDAELAAVHGLIADFPEMSKLPHDAIVDAAASFVSDARDAERNLLREAGVPLDWRQDRDDLMEGT